MPGLERNSCVACTSESSNLEVRAIVAPWIRELTGFSPRSVVYRCCQKCHSGWVVKSYSEVEMFRLYTNYRGPKYLESRSRWEPTYTPHLNSSLDEGDEHLQLRRDALTDLVASSRQDFIAQARVVVDIGGGHGGVIPDWIGLEKKYVLDISGVETVTGVTTVGSWGEISESKVDLVMVCGILEHLTNPVDFLTRLAVDIRSRLSKRPGTLIYFEVPSGVPVRPKYLLKFYFALGLSRFRFMWKLYDRLTSNTRSHFPLRIAEHIQFSL